MGIAILWIGETKKFAREHLQIYSTLANDNYLKAFVAISKLRIVVLRLALYTSPEIRQTY
jgi:hypothetical protein